MDEDSNRRTPVVEAIDIDLNSFPRLGAARVTNPSGHLAQACLNFTFSVGKWCAERKRMERGGRDGAHETKVYHFRCWKRETNAIKPFPNAVAGNWRLDPPPKRLFWV